MYVGIILLTRNIAKHVRSIIGVYVLIRRVCACTYIHANVFGLERKHDTTLSFYVSCYVSSWFVTEMAHGADPTQTSSSFLVCMESAGSWQKEFLKLYLPTALVLVDCCFFVFLMSAASTEHVSSLRHKQRGLFFCDTSRLGCRSYFFFVLRRID